MHLVKLRLGIDSVEIDVGCALETHNQSPIHLSSGHVLDVDDGIRVRIKCRSNDVILDEFILLLVNQIRCVRLVRWCSVWI